MRAALLQEQYMFLLNFGYITWMMEIGFLLDLQFILLLSLPRLFGNLWNQEWPGLISIHPNFYSTFY